MQEKNVDGYYPIDQMTKIMVCNVYHVLSCHVLQCKQYNWRECMGRGGRGVRLQEIARPHLAWSTVLHFQHSVTIYKTALATMLWLKCAPIYHREHHTKCNKFYWAKHHIMAKRWKQLHWRGQITAWKLIFCKNFVPHNFLLEQLKKLNSLANRMRTLIKVILMTWDSVEWRHPAPESPKKMCKC